MLGHTPSEYSEGTGQNVFRGILEALQIRYKDACPVNSDSVIPASWRDFISVPVPDANAVVLVWATRQDSGDAWTHYYTGARVRIGDKKWMALELKDGTWQLDTKKLLAKVEEAIKAKKADWDRQQEEIELTGAARSIFAEDFGVDEDAILMRSPTYARMTYDWGHIWATAEAQETYRITAIGIDKCKTFESLRSWDIEFLVSALDDAFKLAKEE